MRQGYFQKVVQGSVSLLKSYAVGVAIGEQIELGGLIQELGALKYESLGLQKAEGEKAGIGIRNIFEKGGLRITLYFMPEGEVMQLHNHPAMLVITYVLRGALDADLFTPAPTDLFSPAPADMVYEHSSARFLAGEVAFIDGLRTNHNNLHQLKALENTFFLDIMFPDYDEAKECVFFEVEKQLGDKKYQLREAEAKEVRFFEI